MLSHMLSPRVYSATELEAIAPHLRRRAIPSSGGTYEADERARPTDAMRDPLYSLIPTSSDKRVANLVMVYDDKLGALCIKTS